MDVGFKLGVSTRGGFDKVSLSLKWGPLSSRLGSCRLPLLNVLAPCAGAPIFGAAPQAGQRQTIAMPVQVARKANVIRSKFLFTLICYTAPIVCMRGALGLKKIRSFCRAATALDRLSGV